MHHLPATRRFTLGFAVVAFGTILASTALASSRSSSVTYQQIDNALRECQRVSASCANESHSGVGVLVFPSVTKADFIIGGAGGKGALIENGKITDYYSIGAASVGLQAGIENASQVYVFRNTDALNKLKSGQDWKVGADAGVTLITADANAQATDGDILAYVYDSKGLHGGVSLDVFDIWKTNQPRPRAQETRY